MKSQIHKSCLILLLSSSIMPIAFCRSNKFIGGIFLNANGIHIEGNDKGFWQSSSGSGWGAAGLSGGVYAKRNFTRNTYFNLEIRYIQKGGIYPYLNEFGIESSELLRLNYIEVPVLLGFTLRKNKKDYMLETGPGFAKLFSSKFKTNDFVDRNAYPDADNFRKQNISWIGIFKFPLNQRGKKNLLFGLRFSYSLFSIHHNYKLKNLVYGIQVDYVFNR